MTHWSFRCGLRTFFLYSPDRVVAGALNDLQFHDLVFQQCQCPTGPTLGRFRTGQRDQFGLRGTIEDALAGRIWGMLAGEDRVEAVLDQPLAYPREGGDTGIQRFTMRLSLQPSPASETSA